MRRAGRRGFLLAVGALAASKYLYAQEPDKVWRIGFLVQERRPVSLESHRFGAFPRELRKLGYIEGRNLVIEWRFADGISERLPGLAAELVGLKVDVILSATTPTTAAAKKATTTIPIVMASVGDPVGSGFVKSLAQPGGNITGLSNLTGELGPKHLEIMASLVPNLSRVAVLMNPANSSNAAILKSIQAAARRTGVTVVPIEARTPREIEGAFAVMAREHAAALIMAPDALFAQEARQIAMLAIEHRLPSIDGLSESVYAGCLMSYGQNRAENYRLAATYVDKILKGAKPGDLPVEQATKFELFVNGRTARSLGIKIPNSILVRADKVIE